MGISRQPPKRKAEEMMMNNVTEDCKVLGLSLTDANRLAHDRVHSLENYDGAARAR